MKTAQSALPSKHGLAYEWKRNYQLFWMLLPACVFFIIFNYLPMAGVYFAFTSYNFFDGLWGSPFVGFANFRFLFSSGTLMNITRNTLLYNVAFIAVNSFMSILVAIILNELRSRVFKKVTQTLMFLPYFISFVLVAAFVYNILGYEYGVVNNLRVMLGMERISLYDTPSAWKYILVFINLWKNIGYNTVIYLAVITSIDESINEAAEIDGANIFQRIRHITLPHLVPTFIIMLIFTVGNIMKGQFDMFYNIIGNNGILFNATDIIDTYVYRSLRVNFDINMASAAGVYQSVFGLIIVMCVNGIIKRVTPEYALF